MVFGRVVESRQYEGHYYTTVRTPAADEYDSPANVEVRTPDALGPAGTEVEVMCKLHGFIERFPLKDGGEGSRVHVRLRGI